MEDEFSEWDRFYAEYERALTPLDAMASYKKGKADRGRARHREWMRRWAAARKSAKSRRDSACGVTTKS